MIRRDFIRFNESGYSPDFYNWTSKSTVQYFRRCQELIIYSYLDNIEYKLLLSKINLLINITTLQLSAPLLVDNYINIKFNNNIENILLKLPILRNLIITEQRLRKIPESVFKLKYLQSLKLKFNRIINISPEILKNKNLGHINLSGNIITKIPSEITELYYLQILY